MCYSAKVWANYRRYQREFNACISIDEFASLYRARAAGAKIKTPKAMDAAFAGEEVVVLAACGTHAYLF